MHGSYSSAPTTPFLTGGGRARGRLAFGTALVVVMGVLTASPSFASSVSGATFTGGTGTVSSGGLLYAKQGGALTLTVLTSGDTECVDVSGALTAHASSTTTKSSWTFTATAGAGDGVQAVTATASPNVTGQGKCTGPSASLQASFTLDNSGPILTAALSPVPNAAGWNKANVGIAWSATDAGSGVASGPTPVTDAVNANTASIIKAATATDRLGNGGNGSVTVKLDKTSPTVGGTWAPSPNADGWNNSAVTVTLICSDALSGIKSCTGGGSVLLSTEGANQSVSGTAVDNADNAANGSVTGISIDKSAPSLTGTPTTAANASGWYNGDVTIGWNGHDELSGIDPATQPANSTITGEGTALTATASIADKAGNTTTANSAQVRIDRTAPSTGISGTPNSWTNSNVTINLAPTDNLSGIASTSYTVDGAAPQNGTSFTLSSEGDHTVSFFSTDKAGNIETTHTVHVKIDKTAPTIGHSFTLPGYTDGAWTNQDVTVTFVCADSGSGVAGCTTPVTTSTEGAAQQVTGTATDNAGNAATNTALVSIDKTTPTIAAATDRAANGAGWYNDDVTVSFSANDALSGIAHTSPAQVLGEGANQSANGTTTDAAGNSASAGVTGINIDKTAPILTAAYPTGWQTGDVSVTWSCTDALSGVAIAPANDTVTGEGDNLASTATCTDKAGNTASKTVDGIKIDRTAPTTTATVPDPLASGWYAGAVPITLTGHDALSGVTATRYSIDGGPSLEYSGVFTFEQKGTHTLSFWSTDAAGNIENTTVNSITLKIDNIPPTITGAATPSSNSYGWNNSDVNVKFTCSDAETGIAGCGPDTTVGSEGLNQTVQGDALDIAGNFSSTTVDHISIDKTAPDLVGAPTTHANGAGWYNSDVTILWTGDDGLSGIDPSTRPTDSTISGEGADLGASASIFDKAGNKKTASVTGIHIDRTAAVIAGGPTTSPNGAGWYRGQVVVDFTCTDTLSGVASCPTSKIVTGDGANHSITSDPASDVAGNSTPGKTVGGINIDGTAPNTTANNLCSFVNSWCTGSSADVVLTAFDQTGLSGVKEIHYRVNGGFEQVASGSSTTVSVPLTASGAGSVSYWGVDNADNIETPNAVALKWDNIAPTVTHTLSPTPNSNGWNNGDVTVSFAAKDDDAGSGVATLTPPVTVSAETAGQLVNGSATDTAGNVGTDSVTVKLDKTAPILVGSISSGTKGTNGWYLGAVTVHFTCSDALSGVATCPDNMTLIANGANSATGTATDKAGNTASATVSGINIDGESPTISGVNVAGGLYTLGAVPGATCTASDSVSGMDGPCTVTVTGGTPNGVGIFTYTATATDRAGNKTTTTGKYRVIYRFDGFLQPINDTAHQVGTSTSVFKSGSTIPVKFQLMQANGTVVAANSAPIWLTPAKGASMSLPVDESLYASTADSGSTYRFDLTQYIYNWKAAAGGYYYRIGATLDDGQTYYVNIGLR